VVRLSVSHKILGLSHYVKYLEMVLMQLDDSSKI